MLFELMQYCRNFFVVKGKDGKFTIQNGKLDLDGYCQPEQYFLIEGSVFNDGVYQYTNSILLKDEEFQGRVTLLSPPKSFIDLSNEVLNYVQSQQNTPFTSESFGGYSYTKATGSNGASIGWEKEFASRLKAWRKA